MDKFTVLSKAIAALVTSMIMLRIKSHYNLDSLGLTSQVLTAVNLAVDAGISLMVGFMTWLIPLGRKYVEGKFAGQKVIVADANGNAVEGVVIVEEHDVRGASADAVSDVASAVGSAETAGEARAIAQAGAATIKAA